MGGFTTGLAQGLQQAEDRALQQAQLKMQQDMAKYQQKAMETEDQMKQMQLQTLAKKLAFEQRAPSQMAGIVGPQAGPLGAGAQGPETPQVPLKVDPRRVASFLQEASVNGQDPNQLFSYMALMDPTGQIKGLQDSIRPDQFFTLAQGTELAKYSHGQPQAPQQAPQAAPTKQAEQPTEEPLAGIPHEMNPWTTQYINEPTLSMEEQMAKEAQTKGKPTAPVQAAAPIPAPPAAPQAPAQAPQQAPMQTGPGVTILAKNPAKDPSATHMLNATEAGDVGDFARMYPDKMNAYKAIHGHVPNLTQISEFFTPEEFAGVRTDQELRKQARAVEVSREQGVNAAKTAQERLRTDPVMGKAALYRRYNPETGLIDALPDPLMSQEHAIQAGYREINQTMVDKVERFNDIEFDLRPRIARLKNVANAIITSSGGMDAWTQGASLNFDALTRSGNLTTLKDENTGKPITVGEAVQLYKDLIDTIREPYARSINGLKGTATDRDILNAGKAFTSLTQTTALNNKKFQAIDDAFDGVKNSMVASVFGAQQVRGKKPVPAAEADTDFLGMLPPDAKQRYLKMSPDQQARYKRVWQENLNRSAIAGQ